MYPASIRSRTTIGVDDPAAIVAIRQDVRPMPDAARLAELPEDVRQMVAPVPYA